MRQLMLLVNEVAELQKTPDCVGYDLMACL